MVLFFFLMLYRKKLVSMIDNQNATKKKNLYLTCALFAPLALQLAHYTLNFKISLISHDLKNLMKES